jgi:hypothetical protein
MKMAQTVQLVGDRTARMLLAHASLHQRLVRLQSRRAAMAGRETRTRFQNLQAAAAAAASRQGGTKQSPSRSCIARCACLRRSRGARLFVAASLAACRSHAGPAQHSCRHMPAAACMAPAMLLRAAPNAAFGRSRSPATLQRGRPVRAGPGGARGRRWSCSWCSSRRTAAPTRPCAWRSRRPTSPTCRPRSTAWPTSSAPSRRAP